MPQSYSPLITIGIPTYNRANSYLGQTLHSALGQTYENIEIIVSDNCSQDNTEELVRGFSDPRIRYIRQSENIGSNNNFNVCIAQAKGDFCLLLPDDDLIDGDFIESCVKASAETPEVGIIRTGTRLINSDGTTYYEQQNPAAGLTTTDFFLAWFDNKITFYVCSTLFNRKRLQEIGGIKSRHNLFQDVIAEFKLAARYGRVDIMDVKASFRRHEENIGSAAKISAWCEDSLELLDVMCSLIPANSSLIRDKGMDYFCKKMYVYTSKLQSPFERLITYYNIYKMFEYRHSPLRFFYSKKIKYYIERLRASN